VVLEPAITRTCDSREISGCENELQLGVNHAPNKKATDKLQDDQPASGTAGAAALCRRHFVSGDSP